MHPDIRRDYTLLAAERLHELARALGAAEVKRDNYRAALEQILNMPSMAEQIASRALYSKSDTNG